MMRTLLTVTLSGCVMLPVTVAANDDKTQAYIDQLTSMGFPAPKDNQLVHIPPTMADLEEADIHPEL
ncbi:MAG TPA: cytochrome C, partial [Marinobacter hydrocarbonoclasticus]|nr:cytochrome C [Marinobacter nauticus]